MPAQIANNPFHYGDVALGEYFTDRDAELAALELDARSGQNVVIISPRRYGKTSLIVRVAERLRAQQVLVAYVDLQKAPTKDRLADILADAMYAGFVAPLGRALQRAVDVFQKLPIRPRITVNPDGSPAFEFAPGELARDIDRTLEQLFEFPQRIATQRKRRVVLILDEFQEVVDIDAHLPALIRSCFQMQPDVSHIFMGSRRHLMERVFMDRNKPLYRLARPMTLGPIPVEEFASFIHNRFVATGQQIADSAIEHILEITGAHPHDTQELCSFTWALAHVRQTATTIELVDIALLQVLDAENSQFTTIWEYLTPHQRLVLTALTTEGGAIYSEAYRRRHRLGSASSIQRAVRSLVERDLVEGASSNGYRVADVFFREWIAQRRTP